MDFEIIRLEIETITREIIDACLKDKDISTLTNKLFIMTDLIKQWQTKEELHEDLIKSCFCPTLWMVIQDLKNKGLRNYTLFI